MRKVLLSLLIVLIPTPAFANCPSGYCAVTIHNGVETWSDAPRIEIAEPIIKPPTNNPIQVTLSDGNKGGTIYGDQAGVERFTKMLGLNPETTTILEILPITNTLIKQPEQEQLGTSQTIEATVSIANDEIIYPDWWDWWLIQWVLLFNEFNWWAL
jgi:hypothetical protein